MDTGSIMGRNLLVIGGARSGKSAYAEQLATDNFRALNHADASLYYLAKRHQNAGRLQN